MTVFVIMSGNFMPSLRQIIKNRCHIDVANFKSIYLWLRENNSIFVKWLTIKVVEDQEDPENLTLENQAKIQYLFPNNGNPNYSN